jgi:hypothetical protein
MASETAAFDEGALAHDPGSCSTPPARHTERWSTLAHIWRSSGMLIDQLVDQEVVGRSERLCASKPEAGLVHRSSWSSSKNPKSGRFE